MWAKNKKAGFTIVELLIVIVVIAILAAITIVAYSGIQQRARDSKRLQDVDTISKALELYYIDNGKYPPGAGSTSINPSWSTTADGSWVNLATLLRPYASSLPTDPVSTPGANGIIAGYNYSYFADKYGAYCGNATPGQVYILVYWLEGSAQKNTLNGDCTGTALGPYGSSSNYRVVKGM